MQSSGSAVWLQLRSHSKCLDVGVALHCEEASAFHCSVLGESALASPRAIAEAGRLAGVLAERDFLPSADLPPEMREKVEGLRTSEDVEGISLVPIRSKTGLIGVLLLYHQSLE